MPTGRCLFAHPGALTRVPARTFKSSDAAILLNDRYYAESRMRLIVTALISA